MSAGNQVGTLPEALEGSILERSALEGSGRLGKALEGLALGGSKNLQKTWLWETLKGYGRLWKAPARS